MKISLWYYTCMNIFLASFLIIRVFLNPFCIENILSSNYVSSEPFIYFFSKSGFKHTIEVTIDVLIKIYFSRILTHFVFWLMLQNKNR
jgi:hypothetical protein